MELATDSRCVVELGRRASAIGIATLPLAFFVLTLILGLASREGWDAPLGAFWLTGSVLTGPFAELLPMASGKGLPWIYPTLAWLLLLAWLIAAKRTRAGDMHWSIHVALVLSWMICGSSAIPMV